MKSGWSIATLKKDLPLPENICKDRWLFHGIVCAKDLSKTNEQRSFIIGRGQCSGTKRMRVFVCVRGGVRELFADELPCKGKRRSAILFWVVVLLLITVNQTMVESIFVF